MSIFSDPAVLVATITSGATLVGATLGVMLKLWSRDRQRRERKEAERREQDRQERLLDRQERNAERASCEARFAALSQEIQAVRAEYSGEMVAALRESSKAMTVSAIAQQEGTRVLDRVCRRLEGLPCAREAIERRSLRDATPQSTDVVTEPARKHP